MSHTHCPDCGKPNSGIHTCSPQVKKLVRLTDVEISSLFKQIVIRHNGKKPDDIVSLVANAIMDAMEAKNK